MKNYFKKFLVLSLALAMSISFAACNNNEDKTNTEDVSIIEESNKDVDKAFGMVNNEDLTKPYDGSKNDDAAYQEHPDVQEENTAVWIG